jgi:hypothetical protein
LVAIFRSSKITPPSCRVAGIQSHRRKSSDSSSYDERGIGKGKEKEGKELSYAIIEKKKIISHRGYREGRKRRDAKIMNCWRRGTSKHPFRLSHPALTD